MTDTMTNSLHVHDGVTAEPIPPHALDPGLPTPRTRRRMEKSRVRAHAGARSAKGRVRALEARLGNRKAQLQSAETAVSIARRDGEAQFREMSTVQFVAIFVVVSFFQWIVDRGSLLVLRLPLGLTGMLAASLVVISALAAHMAGKLWARKSELRANGLDLEPGELAMFVVSLVGGLSLAVVIAAIRGLYAGGLSGLLFLIAGILLFLLMVYASKRHTNSAVERLERAFRTEQRRQKAVIRAEDRLERGKVNHANARANYVAVCQAIVAQIDAIHRAYALKHPGEDVGTDPTWLVSLRRMADGEIPEDVR